MSLILPRRLAAAVLALALAGAASATTRGLEFWGCWPRSHLSLETTAELVVMADANTTVQVDGAFGTPVRAVGPGTPLTIAVPPALRLAAGRTVLDGGFRVRSLDPGVPITVLFRVPRQAEASDDIARLLPVAELGTDYLVTSYPAALPNEPSFYSVIATEDATTVSAQVPCAGGTSDVVVLNRGQVYQVFCQWRDAPNDVTGARVTADKPVAVLAGSSDAYVPVNYLSGDFVVEAMKPVSAWGREFAVTPLPKGPNAIPGAFDVVVVVASGPGTLDVDDGAAGWQVPFAAAGERSEIQHVGALRLTSDVPVSVHQFATGVEMTDLGDPFMVEIQPVDRWTVAARAYEPPAYTLGSHLDVVTTVADTGTVTVDGVAVTGWQPIPGGVHSWARVTLGVGGPEHEIVGGAPLSVIAHGYNDTYAPDPTLGRVPGSYAYPVPDAVPACAVVALIDAPATSCPGATVPLDASGSTIGGCTDLEYRWLANGVPIPGCGTFSPTPTCDASFAGTTAYVLEVRCASDPACGGAAGALVRDEPALPVAVGPDPAEVCAGQPIMLDGSTGFTRYDWTSDVPDPGVTPASSPLNTLVATPDVDTTYTLTAYDSRGCPTVASLRVTTIPDPIPPPVDASLRVTKSGLDVRLAWQDIPAIAASGYESVFLECPLRAYRSSCGGRVPDPVTIQAAPVVGPPVAVGAQADVHPGALDLGDLIFYKVRALSPCSGSPGPTCNGFPRQLPPCP